MIRPKTTNATIFADNICAKRKAEVLLDSFTVKKSGSASVSRAALNLHIMKLAINAAKLDAGVDEYSGVHFIT